MQISDVFLICTSVSLCFQVCVCESRCHYAQGLFVQRVVSILGFALDKPLDMYVNVTLLSLLCYATLISVMVGCMCMSRCFLLWAHMSRGHHVGVSERGWRLIVWQRGLEKEAVRNT